MSTHGVSPTSTQSLGQIFTHEMKPMEVEILVAEIGHAADGSGDQLFHILYDGTVIDEDISVVLGGETEAIAERLGTFEQPPTLANGLRQAVAALAGPERTLTQTRSRPPCWNGRPSPNVPTARRPRDHRTARLSAQPGCAVTPSADDIDRPLTPTNAQG